MSDIKGICPECGSVTYEHIVGAQLPVKEYPIVEFKLMVCYSCDWITVTDWERSNEVKWIWA